MTCPNCGYDGHDEPFEQFGVEHEQDSGNGQESPVLYICPRCDHLFAIEE